MTNSIPTDTVDWFESRGVELKVEEDNRMFPTTNDSQTIIDCLMSETKKLGVRIALSTAVLQIEKLTSGFDLTLKTGVETFDKVIVASGGSPKSRRLRLVERLWAMGSFPLSLHYSLLICRKSL